MGGGGGAGGGGGFGEMFGQIGGGLAGAASAIEGQKAVYFEDTQGVRLDDASAEEDFYKNVKYNNLREMTTLGALGPGSQDVTENLNYGRKYGDFLAGLGESGGLPSDADMRTSQDISARLFDPERVALRQSFEDSMTQANRQAAILGRAGNDPILMNKLMQEQTRQGALLNARQNARAQELALQLPGQRAAYMGQAAGVKGNLASQAFANRAALLSAGSNAQEQERAWRLKTGTQWQRTQKQAEEKGDFLKGGVGWFKGAAAGGNIGRSFDSSYGGGRNGGYGEANYNPNGNDYMSWNQSTSAGIPIQAEGFGGRGNNAFSGAGTSRWSQEDNISTMDLAGSGGGGWGGGSRW